MVTEKKKRRKLKWGGEKSFLKKNTEKLKTTKWENLKTSKEMVIWVALWLKTERGKGWTCQGNILQKQNWGYLTEDIFQNVSFIATLKGCTETKQWISSQIFLSVSHPELNIIKSIFFDPYSVYQVQICKDLHRVIIWVKISILAFYLQSNL